MEKIIYSEAKEFLKVCNERTEVIYETVEMVSDSKNQMFAVLFVANDFMEYRKKFDEAFEIFESQENIQESYKTKIETFEVKKIEGSANLYSIVYHATKKED